MALARAVRVSTFAIGAILSGFDSENEVVAGRGGPPEVALGTVFGGATFLACVVP